MAKALRGHDTVEDKGLTADEEFGFVLLVDAVRSLAWLRKDAREK